MDWPFKFLLAHTSTHQHINRVRHGNPIRNGNHASNVEWSGSFGLKSSYNVTITRNPQNQLKLI